MKAILLNDTSAAFHTGCELVIKNTLALCEEAGIEIAKRISFDKTPDFTQIIEQHPQVRLVLINGEGTMHHDRPAALALGQAAAEAKQRGRYVVLFNTVWEGNDRLNEFLPNFDLIFCRESLSSHAILDNGYHAETVPDMVFATEPPDVSDISRKQGTAVMDSVSSALSRRLARFSILHGYPFFPLSQTNYDRFSRNRLMNGFLTWRGGAPLYYWKEDLPKALSRFQRAISGRFHGTCLSFLSATPVASIASNTHKIQGLYKDIGLDPNTIHPVDRAISSKAFERQLQHQLEHWSLVEDYVTRAPSRIHTMINTIRNLN